MVFSKVRKDKHFTQQLLADKLGVKQSTVAMWETGKSVPSMKNLLALSVLLGLSIDSICTSLSESAAENITKA